MQVPGRIAPGFTFGAALSYRTFERPCASLPVTTRRMGLISFAIVLSPGCYFSLLQFHARHLHEIRPLHDLALDERGELFRCSRCGVGDLGGKALVDGRLSEELR